MGDTRVIPRLPTVQEINRLLEQAPDDARLGQLGEAVRRLRQIETYSTKVEPMTAREKDVTAMVRWGRWASPADKW